jgi:hypothetical protein
MLQIFGRKNTDRSPRKGHLGLKPSMGTYLCLSLPFTTISVTLTIAYCGRWERKGRYGHTATNHDGLRLGIQGHLSLEVTKIVLGEQLAAGIIDISDVLTELHSLSGKLTVVSSVHLLSHGHRLLCDELLTVRDVTWRGHLSYRFWNAARLTLILRLLRNSAGRRSHGRLLR